MHTYTCTRTHTHMHTHTHTHTHIHTHTHTTTHTHTDIYTYMYVNSSYLKLVNSALPCVILPIKLIERLQNEKLLAQEISSSFCNFSGTSVWKRELNSLELSVSILMILSLTLTLPSRMDSHSIHTLLMLHLNTISAASGLTDDSTDDLDLVDVSDLVSELSTI